ncbi:MAG TPA: metallophosphoesterase family protein [Capsulimonadaceae bacterium]|nr:metallophosphoesterase family protein [Capsulimonadaceae bacterium]
MLVTKAGVIGDIHGEAALLQALLDFLQPQKLDVLLCTGDIVTGEGDVNRSCALLKSAGVLCVRGNHDRWFLQRTTPAHEYDVPEEDVSSEAKEFIASLPVTREFETPAGQVLLCHGLGDDDLACVRPGDEGIALESNHRLHALVMQADYKIIINGHTHQPMARIIEGLTILNAGTLRQSDGSDFFIVDFAAGEVQFYKISPEGQITAGASSSIPTEET